MKDLKPLTGKWKGNFTYGPEFQDDYGRSVDFTLELTDNNGELSGKWLDSETKDLYSDTIVVNGFWDGNLLNFTVQYPFSYYINEQGKAIIDCTKQHPEIIYTGQYNSDTNTFNGDWEMVIASEQYGDGWFDDQLTGTWTLLRD